MFLICPIGIANLRLSSNKKAAVNLEKASKNKIQELGDFFEIFNS